MESVAQLRDWMKEFRLMLIESDLDVAVDAIDAIDAIARPLLIQRLGQPSIAM